MVADGVTDSTEASITVFCQNGNEDESMPPTVPVPASATSACRPLIWFVREPDEYRSLEKLLLNVRSAFLMRALARLMILLSPELMRSSRPDATTLIAIWRHWYSAAEMTSDALMFSVSQSLYRWYVEFEA